MAVTSAPVAAANPHSPSASALLAAEAARPAAADPQAERTAPRTPRRRWWWIQRDSLARRLFIGKPGSRRRNRHDNNTLADHPMRPADDPTFVFDADREPGPCYDMPREPTVFSDIAFSPLRKALVGVSPEVVLRGEPAAAAAPPAAASAARLARRAAAAAAAEQRGFAAAKPAEPAAATPAPPAIAAAGPAHLKRADRRLRQHLRRVPCDQDMLRRFEASLVEFVTESLGRTPAAPAVPLLSAGRADLVPSSDDSDAEAAARAATADPDAADAAVPRADAPPCSSASSASAADARSVQSVDSDDLWDVPAGSDIDDGWVRLGADGEVASVAEQAATPARAAAAAAEPVTVAAALADAAVPAEMELEITSPFLRLLVHAMARYYMLVSNSRDAADGRRITVIKNPFSPAHPASRAARYVFPTTSFADHLFG
ncbi:hypothetical protein HK105_207569 [Polyrhizophydium stewartii]|uniref:R3H domain-containing protein n=1 Tax=Polyrhizophydium stewartii TaxID=2732419 RepID=A0ABR4N044_9FUNG